MTPEELKKQKAAEKTAKKFQFTQLAKFHENEAARYRKQADDCDEVTLDHSSVRGSFGGL